MVDRRTLNATDVRLQSTMVCARCALEHCNLSALLWSTLLYNK